MPSVNTATATACCGGQSCCSVMCIACARCGVQPKNWPKLYYVINAVIFMAISVGLLYSLKGSADKWDWFECLDPNDEEVFNASSCYGIKAVLAMSFTLFLYHLIIFCLGPQFSALVQLAVIWLVNFVKITTFQKVATRMR